MSETPTTRKVLDTVTLRFDGSPDSDLNELLAADVARVLLGLTGIVSDFDKAHVFHAEGPADSQILVRPPEEGSFIIEAVRVAAENPETVMAVVGVPTVSQIIWWATKSVRADVEDFEHLENGNVKVTWQDGTAEEVPKSAWDELSKRKRRRKKQLREIMAPLGDRRVTKLDVSGPVSSPNTTNDADEAAPEPFVLTRTDYDSVAPVDDITEKTDTFEVSAQMQTIDFADSTKWRVKPAGGRARKAVVADAKFLNEVAKGLAISNSDVFRLRIREDTIVKNGRTRSSWTVLKVESHRRTAGDAD